jgi:hypothetical protein
MISARVPHECIKQNQQKCSEMSAERAIEIWRIMRRGKDSRQVILSAGDSIASQLAAKGHENRATSTASVDHN